MNMRELQKMQQRLVKMQEDLEKNQFTGTAGGGAVTIQMSGKYEVTGVKIDPEAFNAEDIEELEVMVKAAAKDAFDKVTDAQQKLVNNATGGMRIPGLF
ncbi:nucleoid-associated protein [Ktedonobacter sp. SOSP1-85]|uniref:Nucleoid-associated protein KSB_01170 n=1 Tax=Ktedonobacter robiniae TaxID=2778365 RepID=A0ABQ3UGS1_9CHLR|nr:MULTISPECIES: YbaB/EbfC family nucleoid-associated protein [Ktedonobacter]GHO51642.1 nucleoid-associated protein [Ktedonobacter robiniae]GHO65007.1 nucleoid-associated protein [Ktedonobacter sp. SOSP1-52]GHO77095.1 nucleoid-associated protein [Ktedonobacter sp. SOSP1-85]